MARTTDNRVVVVTGASSGIGRATARAFAGRGARVVLAARDAAALRDAAAGCERAGGRTLVVPADVSREDEVQRLAQRTRDAFGGIDVWVNAAGVIVYGVFEEIPTDVYRQVIDTNLMGQVHGARAVLPFFREGGGGVLVNVASVWGSVTSPYVSAYAVSKFGIRAFSASLQEEMRLRPETRGIRVCTILPQSVDTPIFRHAANYTGKQVKPVPPVVDPQRVVRAILRSADRPRRQRSVGGFGRLLEMSHAVAPTPFDRLVSPVMKHTALGRTSVETGPGNIFETMPEWNVEEGGWRNRPLRLGAAAATGAAATVAFHLRRRLGPRR